MLGFAYLHGIGLSKNGTLAVRNLEVAAGSSQPIAAHILGEMHFSGQVVQQNYKAAYAFFSSGASRGFAPSQRALAVMTDQGLGTDRDSKKAFELASAAASAEDSFGLMLLGLFCADGIGTSSDTVKALGLLQKAAGRDAPLPNAVMGLVYDMAQLGVQRNREKAIEHYSKAEGLKSGQIWLRLADSTYGVAPQVRRRPCQCSAKRRRQGRLARNSSSASTIETDSALPVADLYRRRPPPMTIPTRCRRIRPVHSDGSL